MCVYSYKRKNPSVVTPTSERSVLQIELLLLQNERSMLQNKRLVLQTFEQKACSRRACCSPQKICNRECTPLYLRFLTSPFVRENAYFYPLKGSVHIFPFRSFGSMTTSSGGITERCNFSMISLPKMFSNRMIAGSLSYFFRM